MADVHLSCAVRRFPCLIAFFSSKKKNVCLRNVLQNEVLQEGFHSHIDGQLRLFLSVIHFRRPFLTWCWSLQLRIYKTSISESLSPDGCRTNPDQLYKLVSSSRWHWVAVDVEVGDEECRKVDFRISYEVTRLVNKVWNKSIKLLLSKDVSFIGKSTVVNSNSKSFKKIN